MSRDLRAHHTRAEHGDFFDLESVHGSGSFARQATREGELVERCRGTGFAGPPAPPP
jgi:hypothetical protein